MLGIDNSHRVQLVHRRKRTNLVRAHEARIGCCRGENDMQTKNTRRKKRSHSQGIVSAYYTVSRTVIINRLKSTIANNLSDRTRILWKGVESDQGCGHTQDVEASHPCGELERGDLL